MTERRTGLYIHIPFCVKKCNYCAFLSFRADPETRKKYLDALCKEIKLRADKNCLIDTVYLGGGTPSVLDVSQMRDIMDTVKSSFSLIHDAEISIEVNPGTLGEDGKQAADKLKAYKDMGFNRLSMGVQSTDNHRLSFLGRIHSAEDVTRDVRIAREAGFDNINLDIIFSVPGESCMDALEDAKRIIELEPEHISCYSLQIEEGTAFCKEIESGRLIEVPDEEDRETYHKLCALLKDSGYEHYEISNFARKHYRSKHNSLYWDMSDYIACGLGASGFKADIRYKNISDMDEYLRSTSAGSLPTDEEYRNTPFDNISEAVFTGLRRVEGISYEEAVRAYERIAQPGVTPANPEELFWELFADARAEAYRYVSSGHLLIDDKGLKLTEKGIDISNSIMALFV